MLASSDEDDDILSDDDSIESSSDNDLDHDYHDFPPRPPSQNYFAPPFYGRPPTPLPPSPSLTSLLRPSRPTTPDASDDDNAAANANGNGASGSNANGSSTALGPVPRAAPQVPTYEYYGFVLYLFSSLAFLVYLLWAYLPRPFLHALGITYYPNRWWALAVPSFLVMTLAYIYVALALYNTERLTVPMSGVETIVDGAGKVAVVDGQGRLRGGLGGGIVATGWDGNNGGRRGRDKGGRLRWREVWSVGTDAVLDVPLGGVCEVLYGEGREGVGYDAVTSSAI